MNNIIRQWIRQAQTGDGEAVLAILQVFRPLLYKYARKYRYCYDSLDEALSTAHLAVLECIYSFELDGKEEGPAALRRAVQTAFRRENRRKTGISRLIGRLSNGCCSRRRRGQRLLYSVIRSVHLIRLYSV